MDKKARQQENSVIKPAVYRRFLGILCIFSIYNDGEQNSLKNNEFLIIR